ncbi:MAG: hypothetical protein OEL77_00120 [Nitrosopumilus sp.]|nr:hypothetical protein [Nitrosopumilus sp.]MDH3384407.1 hypothetical protein [Nitrosopumilus sp.]
MTCIDALLLVVATISALFYLIINKEYLILEESILSLVIGHGFIPSDIGLETK